MSNATTKLGELKTDRKKGTVFLVIGITVMAVSIPLIFAIIGIFTFIGGIIFLGAGIGQWGGYYEAVCPVCSKDFHLTKRAESIKCPKCKKRLVKTGDALQAVG